MKKISKKKEKDKKGHSQAQFYNDFTLSPSFVRYKKWEISIPCPNAKACVS